MTKLLLGGLVALALCQAASTATAQVTLGIGYTPDKFDTYVPANAGACCIGDYYSLTTAYIAQTFTATGRSPKSITVDFANNLPSDVPPAPARFRLLLTEIAGPSKPAGKILWESDPQALPVSFPPYSDTTLSIRGVRLDVGKQYAWILDTYSDRDGVQDVLAYTWNDGFGTQGVPAYTGGAAWYQGAYGQGRASDFAYPWTYAYGSVGFLIRYRN